MDHNQPGKLSYRAFYIHSKSVYERLTTTLSSGSFFLNQTNILPRFDLEGKTQWHMLTVHISWSVGWCLRIWTWISLFLLIGISSSKGTAEFKIMEWKYLLYFELSLSSGFYYRAWRIIIDFRIEGDRILLLLCDDVLVRLSLRGGNIIFNFKLLTVIFKRCSFLFLILFRFYFPLNFPFHFDGSLDGFELWFQFFE